MNENLFARFQEQVPLGSDAAFLITPEGRQFSYADMAASSARVAALLMSRGLRPGDRITVQIPKSPEAVWLYLACLRAGLVFHPLNDAYTAEEIAYLVGDAGPLLAVCHPQSAPLFGSLLPDPASVLTLDEHGKGSLADAAHETAPEFETRQSRADDLAILLYTSGTTGKPKGAMITHGNLAANAAALVNAWGFTSDDRLLHALPLYHAHGLFVGLGCTLMSGASMLLLPRFDAREVIAHLPGCTVMMGVPTYYTRLLREPSLTRETCRRMRVFISGSAPLSPEVFNEFAQRTGHELLERYGMTETGMNTSNPLRGQRRPGSVGPALPGVTVRIVGANDTPLPAGEIGEVQLKGPNVFRGYWRLPEKTAEAFTADGYFRTGDQGFLSHDSYLTISGRSKDLIISGGLNVYPREVEILLDSLPGIAESTVIGVPHFDFGEAVVAVVVAKPGVTFDEAGIIESLRERLAAFKLPKRIFLVPELPRNAMGKVEKTVLRQRCALTFAD